MQNPFRSFSRTALSWSAYNVIQRRSNSVSTPTYEVGVRSLKSREATGDVLTVSSQSSKQMNRNLACGPTCTSRCV